MNTTISQLSQLDIKIGQNAQAIARLETKFDELLDYLAGHFSKIEDQFQIMNQRFEQIDQRFEKVDSRLQNLENNQDYMIGELKTLRQENTFGAFRSHRMEQWITKAGKKINLPYSP